MLKTALPRRRYGTTDYPNLDANSYGKVIPIGYGTITNIAPTEISTTEHKWKIVGQALASITSITSTTRGTLAKNKDYSEDLPNGEFTLHFNERFELGALGHTYYFAINGDFALSATHYATIGMNDSAYANGVTYNINGARGWVSGAANRDVRFALWGKTGTGATETKYVDNASDTTTAGVNLRDNATHTAIGQSFTVGTMFFPTKITIYGCSVTGAPTGNVWITFYESITPEAQFGPASANVDVVDLSDTDFTVAEISGDEELSCAVVCPSPTLNKVGDILEDLIVNHLGKSASLLDPTELANLEADRTQVLKVFLNDGLEFDDVVAKLEAGQMWKLVPLQNGTYGTIVYEAGEPANMPHFRDDDFLSFSMEYDASKLVHEMTVFYGEDAGSGEFLGVKVSSDAAKFFYSTEDAHSVETYLTTLADGDQLADDYLARYEVPVLTVRFEVHGWALDLLPGRDKVKITRSRAAYTGGALNGVVFRITKLVKKPESNVVEITASVWSSPPEARPLPDMGAIERQGTTPTPAPAGLPDMGAIERQS